jgi:hypothetical protein
MQLQILTFAFRENKEQSQPPSDLLEYLCMFRIVLAYDLKDTLPCP